MDVIKSVLTLMEAMNVLAWMDMNWNQIIALVQVMTTLITQIVFPITKHVHILVDQTLVIYVHTYVCSFIHYRY